MSFLYAETFWLLGALALLLLKWHHDGKLQRIGIQGWWMIVAAALVIVALSRPVMEQEPVEVERGGSDVILAIDLSYSMQADDIAPTRLAAAKAMLKELVRHNTRERFGVIGFTTNAIVLSPLTNDAELLLHLFEGVDESLIMTKGTVLMPALKLARRMSKARRPVVLLFSDGGDANDYAKEAAFAEANDLRVHTVMMATAFGTTLTASSGELVKDEAQNIVVTARNDAIEALSRATGGEHITSPDAAALQGLIDDARSDDYSSKTKMIQYEELFYYAVMLAIIAFMMSVTTLAYKVRRIFLGVLLLLGVGAQGAILDFYHLERADSAYSSEAYERSAAHFGALEGKHARYNQAHALYKAGLYEKALEVYANIRSSDPQFKAALFYNMGNCYIRLKEFAKAREAFGKSLALHYERETVENLLHIRTAQEQEGMITGQQKGKQRAQDAESEQGVQGDKKRKGGSNMPVDAPGGSGDDGGKKTESDPRLNLSQGKAKLSSKQYELINKRSIHEARPW